ncbi:kelch-like protein 3 isoform X2 [Acyrthosiphon pisum]|uniref:BACK domain-containing protein n=1 Tax=Acyrthosiphon pisum TaxID=7029 RepID=A0A8R2H6J1_ACYPI|nr:kelch-like protein 3 isoform X2 [Acyrthosiphon pisum]|eukprot:XP_016658157.1 PREDICTED: kelch-like protein 3 [Acyrthosiphon pisum]
MYRMLLPAAKVLQLDYVNGACIEFLQKQLDPSNCFRIKEVANLHDYTELLSSSEAFIKQHFLEVVKGKDFLSLSSDDLVKLISCNDLAVSFEEKVKIMYLMHYNSIYKNQFSMSPFQIQLRVNLDSLAIHKKLF